MKKRLVKNSKKRRSPPKLASHAIEYLDKNASEDYSLRLLSSLLMKIAPDETINADEAGEISHFIQSYLHKKRILAQAFFTKKVSTSQGEKHEKS